MKLTTRSPSAVTTVYRWWPTHSRRSSQKKQQLKHFTRQTLNTRAAVRSKMLVQQRFSVKLRAQELDPLSLIINVRVGMTAYFSRQFPLAEKQLRDTLQFDPDFVLTNIFLFNTLYQQDKIEESIPFLVTGLFNNYSKQERSRFEAEIRQAYSTAGKRRMWETVRNLLKTSPKRDYSYAFLIGLRSVILGEKDEAFEWLNRSADVKHPGVSCLRVDPVFDALRTDRRFEALQKRVGI